MARTRAQARQHREVFRFMDLPPELRMQVYEQILSGRTIHMGHLGHTPADDDARCLFGCVASPSDEQRTEQLRASDGKEVMGFKDMLRHLHCNTAVFKAGELAILSVCKQIYQEASNVHLSTSLFVCDYQQSLIWLCRVLNPVQQAALTSLKLVQNNGHPAWRVKLPDAHITALKALKHVQVHAELVVRDFVAEGDLRDIAHQDRMFEALQSFGDLPVRSVNVLIQDNAPRMKTSWEAHPAIVLTKAEIVAWETRVKRMMMPSLSDGGNDESADGERR